jgi:hypothetical protein
MQQLITGLLFVNQIQLNMFRASLCPSSGAYQLQQQPLVYRRNVVVAVLLAVVSPVGILQWKSDKYIFWVLQIRNQNMYLL